MGISSRQVQEQSQTQTQTLSPQQILTVKLIELPTIEMEERVKSEILDNPALEEGKDDNSEDVTGENENNDDNNYNNDEDIELGDYRSEDDIPDYKLQEHNNSKAERAEDIPFSDAISFYEILKEQLSMLELTDQQNQIAEYLIGSLDHDGLLRKPLENICDELAIYRSIYTDIKEIKDVLSMIQDFDPAGIGACSLKECLLIQIKRKENSTSRDLEYNIINDCFEEFTHKNKDKVLQKLNITEEQYDEALKDLVKLNPCPGSSLGETIGRNLQQITPDFIVESYEDGSVSVNLNNRNEPELKMNNTFSTMLDEYSRNKSNQSKESKDAFIFLKQKMDAAQGFINAVNQRRQTLLSTMQAIVNYQKEFFIEGDESELKPMILKDIAEQTKLDISTVSRVSNNKYVQTNFGIFPLKYFFSDGYVTNSGEELSVREIKRILKECVDGENKAKPFTDDELTEILKSKGYPIARRTVAKYRLQLNIPVARLRR